MSEPEQKQMGTADQTGLCQAQVLGVTGGIGSGKSAVLSILKEDYGFRILETDRLAKELMCPGTPCYERLKEAFGKRILAEDGRIDRQAYASLIYGSEELRRRSDEIVHPAVWKLAEDRIGAWCKEALNTGQSALSTGQQNRIFVALETALPGERYRKICSAVMYVFAPEPVRIARLMENRGYSYERCLAIMRQQIPEEAYTAYADVFLDNGGSMEESRIRLDAILQNLFSGSILKKRNEKK